MQKNPSSRKKILYVITKSNWGGAQRYVYDLAVHFAKTCDVAVVSGPSGLLHEKLKDAGIRTIAIASLQRDVNPLFDIKTFFALLAVFLQEKPDVVHLNSSKIGGIGAVAGRLYGRARIIFTAHGWAFNEDRNPLSKAIIKFLHWITLLFCHQTVAVSEMTKRQMSNLPGMSHAMTVIYNGISKDEIAALLGRDDARNTLKSLIPALTGVLDSNTLLIGTTSELHPNKGLIYLIRAISTLQLSMPFVCVIMGEGEQRNTLEALIREKNLQDRVILAGYVKGAPRYARAFDILTLTSVTEAFPYALIEAGAAERAVIASSVGGIPEIISHMNTGILVTPKNEQEIADALSLLAHNPDKRDAFGKALSKKVADTFSKDTMYKKTAEIYHLS